MQEEEIRKQLRMIEEENQNKFIAKIYDDIQHLAEKSIRKTYVVTDYERYMFNNIVMFVNNMKEWF